MAKPEISLSMDERHLDWLQTMADKYNLPTADKALRIAILCAKHEEETSEATIFQQIDIPSPKAEILGKHAMDKVHEDYLEKIVAEYKLPSKDKAVQIIVENIMTHVDEKTLFEVKRCKHGATCKHCK